MREDRPNPRGALARKGAALSTLARAADIEGRKPYRYHGDPDWTPGPDKTPRVLSGGQAATLAAIRDEAAKRCGLDTYPHDIIRAAETAELQPWPGEPIQ